MAKREWVSKKLLIALVIDLWASAAYAYIPPSNFILTTWVAKHVHQKKLKTVSTVSAGEVKPGQSVHFKEIMVLTDGANFRSWALNDSEEVLFYQEKAVKDASLPAQFLMSSSAPELARVLQKQGLPLLTGTESLESTTSEQESLVRANETVAWVIAEKPIQRRRPQVWFEKDTFLPLRLVYTREADSKVCDLKFDNYRRDFAFPRTIFLNENDQGLSVKSQVTEITAYASGPDKTPKVSTPGWTAAGSASSPELKNLIRSYYQNLR